MHAARRAGAGCRPHADDFAAEVATLCTATVTDRQWQAFLDAHVPLVDSRGDKLTDRSATRAEHERAALNQLYRHADRIAPWAGSAHGVLQAVNTYRHHEGTSRGATRAERNMLRTVTGRWEAIDRSVYTELAKVLVADLWVVLSRELGRHRSGRVNAAS